MMEQTYSIEELKSIKDDIVTLLQKLGILFRQGFTETDKDVDFKRDKNDLLTKYDIAINTHILEYLQKYYPEISIISEEANPIPKNSEYTFLVDPIDGTRNFVRGIPMTFIGVGLALGKEVVLSVTYNPITNEMFHAIKGYGTYLNDRIIHVSQRNLSLADIVVRTLPDKKMEKVVVGNIIEKVHQVKNNMCCHEEISGVACDKYDGFISKGSSSRDYCHYLLVIEAGGKVTDRQGETFDISKDNIIVSNGSIHKELLSAVQGS